MLRIDKCVVRTYLRTYSDNTVVIVVVTLGMRPRFEYNMIAAFSYNRNVPLYIYTVVRLYLFILYYYYYFFIKDGPGHRLFRVSFGNLKTKIFD